MAETFDERLDQVERAWQILSTIDNPEIQGRALDLLVGVAQASVPARRNESDVPTNRVTETNDPDVGNAGGETGQSSNGGAAGAGKKNGATKRSKPSAASADKTVDLAPPGITGWTDYATEKAPATREERYAVAVYWLTEVAALPKATVNQVVYLHIAAKWPLPSDPRNAASQTARKGHLASGNGQDLKMTSLGQALVLNDLPRQK